MPFTAIGTAITAGAATGGAATAIGVGSVLSTGLSLFSGLKGIVGGQGGAQPPALPKKPNEALAAEKARQSLLSRRRSQTKRILTSPLGTEEKPGTVRKEKLGG